MAQTTPPFGRQIVAMVTPFDEERELDLDRVQEFADRLVVGGNDAIIVNGTTGESPTVFYPQKMDLFRAVVEAVAGRVPVIANVGDNCTADTVSFARDVEPLGVDGLMCVVPYYNKPPQEGLYQHFRTIAGSVGLPIILYNIPGRCVINMEAETTVATSWPSRRPRAAWTRFAPSSTGPPRASGSTPATTPPPTT